MAWTGRDGIVTFVATGFDAGTTDAEDAARTYLETFADAYGSDVATNRFVLLGVTETAAGTVVRFDQLLGDLRVFAGAVAVTVSDSGVVTRVAGTVAREHRCPPP